MAYEVRNSSLTKPDIEVRNTLLRNVDILPFMRCDLLASQNFTFDALSPLVFLRTSRACYRVRSQS